MLTLSEELREHAQFLRQQRIVNDNVLRMSEQVAELEGDVVLKNNQLHQAVDIMEAQKEIIATLQKAALRLLFADEKPPSYDQANEQVQAMDELRTVLGIAYRNAVMQGDR